jgi:hypothetical protein
MTHYTPLGYSASMNARTNTNDEATAAIGRLVRS